LSTALSWAVRHACDPGFLRYTNVLLAATVLPWSIVGILKAKHRHAALWEVLAISSFPLVTFFSLLYYTDVGSSAFVILGYWAAQEKRYVWSAIVSSSCCAIAVQWLNRSILGRSGISAFPTDQRRVDRVHRRHLDIVRVCGSK
jgi:hypothetical protein